MGALAPTSAAAAKPRPDLTVKQVANPPLTASPGDKLALAATVGNRGKKKAARSQLAFLLSSDGKPSKGDPVLGSVRTPKLRKGKRRQLGATVAIPLSLPLGAYFVIACADRQAALRESKEGNNCRASATRVGITRRALPLPSDPPQDDPAPPENPPAENPPADNPPAEDPPAEDPPADDPPAPLALTVLRDGTGDGTVASDVAGIMCGADCSESYPPGTSVTLTAAPSEGSLFTGWSGGGCSGTGTCQVTMNQATEVTATFTLQQHTLVVSRNGNGSGTVISNPAGINCGGDCSEAYNHGAFITLNAAPSFGSTFSGWSGGGCSGTGTCQVTMNQATQVTATFTLQQHTLTVARAGNGVGTVTSNPAGINCGADCFEPYNHGTSVTLFANPSSGSVFTGWSGSGCSGTGTCVVSMTQVGQVTATFTLQQHQLTVLKAGNGTGTVTSNPAGISCGGDCSAAYNHGTLVTLVANPSGGSTFTGWSGGACSGTGTCQVTMNQATQVTATFMLQQHTLSVNKNGDGMVTSNPAGINCGVDCSQAYNHGTIVTLAATPALGWTFVGWSGGCSGTGSCIVSMTQPRQVTASFVPSS